MSTLPASPRRIQGRAAIVYRRDGHFTPPAEWPTALAACVRRLDFGNRGSLFLAFDGVDVAEDGVFLVARLGVLRSPRGTGWTARKLLAEGVASPAGWKVGELSGNGLALAFDLDAPRFAVFGTLLSVPQLYFWPDEDRFAAATEPGLLLPLLDRVEIDDDAVPAHFLFRFVPGYDAHIYAGGRKPAFLLLLAFILTLAGTRFYTRMARIRGWGSVHIGEVHVHHLVPGVVMTLVAGGLVVGL